MLAYRVDDMTCGHCASAITKAVRAVDGAARVDIDLDRHLVTVQSAEADAGELRDAITEAGYTPIPMQLQATADKRPEGGGCCCGSRSRTCA